MSIKDAATKASETVAKALTGTLTDTQWEARIAKSQQKLDTLKEGIVTQVVNGVDGSERSTILTALGLEPPKEDEKFTFELDITLTRTFSVTAKDRATAAKLLIAKFGENGEAPAQRFGYDSPIQKASETNVKRDMTKVIKARDTVTETKATDTPATPVVPLVERFAALEAAYEDLVAKAQEQAKWLRDTYGGTYCLDGINRVLKALGLEPLPSKQYFTVDLPVTGINRQEVSAYTQDEANKLAKQYADSSRKSKRLDNGVLINPVFGDVPKAV